MDNNQPEPGKKKSLVCWIKKATSSALSILAYLAVYKLHLIDQSYNHDISHVKFKVYSTSQVFIMFLSSVPQRDVLSWC